MGHPLSKAGTRAIAALIVVLAALAGIGAERFLLAGWSLDQSISLRHLFFGDRHELARSPVAVLAIDEATFDHPAFRSTPMALWGPQLGQILGALDRAGAKVIGLDLIPMTTVETIAPGHDRPLIAAIQKLGAASRLVLARADFAGRALVPHPIFAFVAGGANIRSVNVSVEEDGIARRLPLWLESSAGRIATLVAEIARRSGADPGSGISGGEHLVNYSDAAIAPTYSMAETMSCLEAGDEAALAQAWRERIVLIGATLEVEDRKSVSARAFINPAAGIQHLDCAEAQAAPASARRNTLPGVYILAQAINDLVRGEILHPLPSWLAAIAAIAMALAGGAFGWWLGAARGGSASVGLLLAWFALSGFAAGDDLILPLGAGGVALIGGFFGVQGFRALVVEREKRRIAHALGRYLDEKVALALLSGSQPIELGGEMREITVWFSDIAGFSTIAEGVAPKELVRRLNAHFTVLTEAIEAEGGIIDKFVGDAVVAIFGAPAHQSDHAARALKAAHRAMRRLLADPDKAGGFRVRIGINTGMALVGNVGSDRRFDYTAIGDAVNIAQRLEAANKEHGTSVLVSAATAEAAGHGFPLRPVGPISLKGRAARVEALELVIEAGSDPQG